MVQGFRVFGFEIRGLEGGWEGFCLIYFILFFLLGGGLWLVV